MVDFEQRLAKVREQIEVDRFDRVDLLHEPQFTNADVEAAAYVTPTQLHNWVSRRWILLSGGNPGKGKRRLYSGQDAISVAIAAALQPFGMMQVADQMIRFSMISIRAHMLLMGAYRYGYALAIVPTPDGSDCLYFPLTPETSEPNLPTPSCVVLDVDRLIVETAENLLRVVAGEKIPSRAFPKKKTQAEVHEEQLEEMGTAYRDDEGRRIYRGLSIEESAEFDALSAANTAWRLGENTTRPSHEDRDRYLELSDKNERARLAWLGQRFAAEAAARAPDEEVA